VDAQDTSTRLAIVSVAIVRRGILTIVARPVEALAPLYALPRSSLSTLRLLPAPSDSGAIVIPQLSQSIARHQNFSPLYETSYRCSHHHLNTLNSTNACNPVNNPPEGVFKKIPSKSKQAPDQQDTTRPGRREPRYPNCCEQHDALQPQTVVAAIHELPYPAPSLFTFTGPRKSWASLSPGTSSPDVPLARLAVQAAPEHETAVCSKGTLPRRGGPSTNPGLICRATIPCPRVGHHPGGMAEIGSPER